MICFAGIRMQVVTASDYHGCFTSWRVVVADNRMGLIDKTVDNKFHLNRECTRERRHPQKHKAGCGPGVHHGEQIGTIAAECADGHKMGSCPL